jgi:hypothetical protein
LLFHKMHLKGRGLLKLTTQVYLGNVGLLTAKKDKET